MNLFGVDILIQEETGLIFIIDINYYSSYDGVKNLDVPKSLRHLIRETHNQNQIKLKANTN